MKSKEKIKVHYVCGPIGDPDKEDIWGGTKSTNYTIKKAFEDSEKYELVIKPRDQFFSIEEVYYFLNAGDLSWLDETSIAQKYFMEGHKRPDVMGPICRSPVKRYNQGEWFSFYTPEWFYSGRVLRLNEAEEKDSTLLDKYKDYSLEKNHFVFYVDFIRHAVDTNLLRPNDLKNKKYILWAGNTSRGAKNYELFEKIKERINKTGGLKEGFEFKTLTNYNIQDYFNLLDETAILINTSKYESFCCAVAESMAKGVPSIVRNEFNGDYMFRDRPLQVNYEVNSYVNKILELIDNEELWKEESKKAREYAEKNFSMETMRKDIEKVFDEVMEKKNGKKI